VAERWRRNGDAEAETVAGTAGFLSAIIFPDAGRCLP